jgi:hypothetical protein
VPHGGTLNRYAPPGRLYKYVSVFANRCTWSALCSARNCHILIKDALNIPCVCNRIMPGRRNEMLLYLNIVFIMGIIP